LAPFNAQAGRARTALAEQCAEERHLGKIPASFCEKFAAPPKKPCPLKGLRAHKVR
jgi:hypothetical protein